MFDIYFVEDRTKLAEKRIERGAKDLCQGDVGLRVLLFSMLHERGAKRR